MSETTSFYEQDSFPTIEQAILAEDITFSEIENIEAKFYIRVMTPTLETFEPSKRSQGGLTKSNYVNLVIPGFMLLQYIDLKEEKCFVKIEGVKYYIEGEETGNKLIFTATKEEHTIPKGTIFFIEFLGGDMEVEKAYIVGMSPLKVE